MHAASATQIAPKDKRPACTFTGPNRSRRVPRAMRTKIVEPTAATPAFAMMPLQLVPAVQTQLDRMLGRYFIFSSAVPVVFWG